MSTRTAWHSIAKVTGIDTAKVTYLCICGATLEGATIAIASTLFFRHKASQLRWR